MSIYIVLALAFFTGGIASFIAEKKGRSHREGFFLGFLFGLLGILIVLLPKKKKEN
ncbi:MAG: hypothetical protein ACPIA1_04450 [Flavobacteriaceae bacterium]